MSYGLGVDLGTTFTAAAVCEPDRSPRMVQLGGSSFSIPSVVHLGEGGEFLVGEAAELKAAADPLRVARHFKRRLGDTTPVLIAGTPFDASALTVELLRGVLREVSDRQGAAPDEVVLTHPASWGAYRLELFGNIARSAGIESVTFVAEPEAAAIEYAANAKVDDGELLGVYDLGGGTFDAAVVRRVGERFDVVGRPAGLDQLGGIDFDEAVLSFVVHAAGLEIDPDDPEIAAAGRALRRQCVDAKLLLSADTAADVRVSVGATSALVRLTRSEFEALIRPLVDRTASVFDEAVSGAGVGAEDLERLLLVGGSSRVPLVAAVLSSVFERPLSIDADPKSTIALGSARFAASLLDAVTDSPSVPARLVEKRTFVDLEPTGQQAAIDLTIDESSAPIDLRPSVDEPVADATVSAAAPARLVPPTTPPSSPPTPPSPTPAPASPSQSAPTIESAPAPGDDTATPATAEPSSSPPPLPIGAVSSESSLRARVRPLDATVPFTPAPSADPVGSDVEPTPPPLNRAVLTAVVVTALVVGLVAIFLTSIR